MQMNKNAAFSHTIGMKMLKLRSSALIGIMTLLLSASFWQKGELTDISKPYLGVYDCTVAEWNGENLLERFDDFKLELKDKGEYVLYVKIRGENKKRIRGKYRYDTEKKTICLRLPNTRFIQREFPLEKGVITVTVPYGEKTLRLQFTRK